MQNVNLRCDNCKVTQGFLLALSRIKRQLGAVNRHRLLVCKQQRALPSLLKFHLCSQSGRGMVGTQIQAPSGFSQPCQKKITIMYKLVIAQISKIVFRFQQKTNRTSSCTGLISGRRRNAPRRADTSEQRYVANRSNNLQLSNETLNSKERSTSLRDNCTVSR